MAPRSPAGSNGDESARRLVWSVYMVRTRGGSLYTGITTDVARRLAEHARASGRGAKSLRGRGPLQLVMVRRVGTRGQALRLEREIKRLSKVEKEALARTRRRNPSA